MIGSKKGGCSGHGINKSVFVVSLSDSIADVEVAVIADLGPGSICLVRMNDAGVQKWALQYNHSKEADHTLIAESQARAATAIEDGGTSTRFSLMTMISADSSQQVTDTMTKNPNHNVASLDLYLHNQESLNETYAYKIYAVNRDTGFNDDMIVTVIAM